MQLKVLYIEDSPQDAEIATEILRDSGVECDVTLIDTESDLRSALQHETYDLILSDCSLPAFNGIAALAVARELRPQLPFIFVSGTLGEELAIECVKCGATDYVLKQRLSRLPPVVRRAMDEVNARRRHEQARRELAIAQEAFYQSQKLETIGRLTAGIAHDFNNMLAVVNGYAEIIRGRTAEDDPLHQFASEIVQASLKAADLVGQLLSYSRNQTLSPSVLNINDEITRTHNMLQRLVHDRITMSIETSTDPWPVEMDPVRLDQVLMNLVANARDAMPEGGTLRITTRNETIAPDAGRPEIDLSPGDYVAIAVADSGTGIDGQTLKSIFEPFFTTKEIGKGTGLGLASSLGIIKQSGGTITVSSTVGTGSTFTVYLPRTNITAIAQDERQNAAPRSTGVPHETALLVDNDNSYVNFMKLVLEDAAYKVLVASTCRAALALVDSSDLPIDLVITDVLLSDSTGADLFNAILDRRPSAKVLYTSAHASSVLNELGISPTRVPVAHKPMAVSTFLARVRDTLDANTPNDPQ